MYLYTHFFINNISIILLIRLLSFFDIFKDYKSFRLYTISNIVQGHAVFLKFVQKSNRAGKYPHLQIVQGHAVFLKFSSFFLRTGFWAAVLAVFAAVKLIFVSIFQNKISFKISRSLENSCKEEILPSLPFQFL